MKIKEAQPTKEFSIQELLRVWDETSILVNQLNAKRKSIKADIEKHYSDVTGTEGGVPREQVGIDFWDISKRSRITETVTKKGKDFLQVHFTHETIAEVMKITETEYLDIRRSLNQVIRGM